MNENDEDEIVISVDLTDEASYVAEAIKKHGEAVSGGLYAIAYAIFFGLMLGAELNGCMRFH